MNHLLGTLAAGLRRLEPDGRLTPEPAAAEDLQEWTSLFEVGLKK